jgi:putative nucleotidyltransferase with HDIG domain
VSGAVEIARAALAGEAVWVVGGTIRDRLLGRSTDDVDLVTTGEARAHARAIARKAGGTAFQLSGTHGAWRAIARDRSWHADVMPLEGETIEEDLARRDFTVNALAEPLAGGELIDPLGGAGDVRARVLRRASERSLAADPLRVARLVRIAMELEFEVDPATGADARAQAPRLADVAPERVFGELKRILAVPRPDRGVLALDEYGALEPILPEVAALRGVEQSRFHHLDVFDHTVLVLEQVAALEADPEPVLGEHAAAAAAVLEEPLGDELTRGQALRLGALLHDAAKPQTRAVTPEGRVTFLGHDAAGAELARGALARLRTSERLRSHVAALALHHLRLGFLVHDRPLPRRTVHWYLRTCEPVEVDVTILSVADRLATRGDRADDAIAAHLDLARELLGDALRWRAEGPPPALVRGDELAAELDVPRGPALGELMAELEAAQFADEVATRDDAIAHARERVAAARR